MEIWSKNDLELFGLAGERGVLEACGQIEPGIGSSLPFIEAFAQTRLASQWLSAINGAFESWADGGGFPRRMTRA